MRVIEVIETAWKYNELLKKIAEANIWFGNPKVSQETKDNFEKTKYDAVWKQLGELSEKLDEAGITYKGYESMEVIELPETLKRKDVEIWLESLNKVLKKQEKEKVGA